MQRRFDSPRRVLSPMNSTCIKISVDFKPILEQRFSIDTASVPVAMMSGRSSMSEESPLPTLDGGEPTRGLASCSTTIQPVLALAGSIDGLLVGAMDNPSKPVVDVTFGTSQYASSRASVSSALLELGRWVSDNIERLPPNICLFSGTKVLLMDDPAT